LTRPRAAVLVLFSVAVVINAAVVIRDARALAAFLNRVVFRGAITINTAVTFGDAHVSAALQAGAARKNTNTTTSIIFNRAAGI
jgi:hypothetical protein|tara:strand:+ start:164 stop:415 length:252 start_codon:yes stop_codon:yes gene_type:complete